MQPRTRKAQYAEDFLRAHDRILHERCPALINTPLLRDVGEFRLARWLTDRFGADWKFLAHFYRTGEKVRFESEAGADEPLLTALPIPSFIPQRWPPRGSI